MSDHIETVIRVHDPSRLFELDRALFSISNQSYHSCRPIVVCQRFDADEIDAVEGILSSHSWERFQETPILLNYEHDEPLDARSCLLNLGIAHSTGRYLAILDSDDYVYENAYAELISSLQVSDADISFGKVISKHVKAMNSWIYNVGTSFDFETGKDVNDLIRDNFCPIHSFVVDKADIDGKDLYFNEKLSRLEDYDFLLRICSKYKADFSKLSVLVGAYNWHIDGGNTSVSRFDQAERQAEKNIQWNDSRKHIWHLKLKTRARSSST